MIGLPLRAALRGAVREQHIITLEAAMPDLIETQLAPGHAIPTPLDFPVRWEHPGQARQLWTLDRQHFGHPLPPLVADVWCHQALAGTNRAMARYQLPIQLEMSVINGYLY